MTFLEETAQRVGEFHRENFQLDAVTEFQDLVIESPIEQILYVALKAVAIFNRMREEFVDFVYLTRSQICTTEDAVVGGYSVQPQRLIGKYRVDFLVRSSVIRFVNKKVTFLERQVIVECDSQEWHERTEVERRYEKRRDRDLQRQGFTVFHYTGAEILKRPSEIAAEIFSFVTGEDINLFIK